MNKYVATVIVIVLMFLGLIIGYTMTPSDAPDAGTGSAAATKPH